ncbi:MAG: hypothetical protein HQ513_08810 [Rhodospirillales bacterium]|nr:hypothetical protein [Rhodospirillales bacterium]
MKIIFESFMQAGTVSLLVLIAACQTTGSYDMEGTSNETMVCDPSGNLSGSQENDTQELSITQSGSDPKPNITERRTPEKYLGVWMPAVMDNEDEYSLKRREDLVSIGANTVSFGIMVPYDKSGKIFKQYMDLECLKETVSYYKEAGLAVAISLEPILARSNSEPKPLQSSTRKTFLAEIEPIVREVASLAEDMGVEVFAPMNEQDYKLGVERGSSWGQEILPTIREVFSGKVMWKGSLFEHVMEGRNLKIDFSGYDIVGFSSFPFSGINKYSSEVRAFTKNIRAWAKEDGIEELWIAEFGTYEMVPIRPEQETDALKIVFKEGKAEGYFVFDPPRGFGTPILRSKLEKVVREEYSNLGSK